MEYHKTAVTDRYFCPRCSFELKASMVSERVGTQFFDPKLHLQCENCGFSWYGDKNHSPVDPR